MGAMACESGTQKMLFLGILYKAGFDSWVEGPALIFIPSCPKAQRAHFIREAAGKMIKLDPSPQLRVKRAPESEPSSFPIFSKERGISEAVQG
ncbi:hypothetical protein CEXT_373051 [Caerostris extrusa]|uniref:Uncharacterized protein n=1 Tax=Caerostris extrusa TaxID=172846 RepID=A0AAV4UBJ1_CAEEX|nr:hypothetical protein CEXT_373051 [Caerostris extrusa]